MKLNARRHYHPMTRMFQQTIDFTSSRQSKCLKLTLQ